MLVVSFAIDIFAASLLAAPFTQSGTKVNSMTLCFTKLAYSVSCRISPDVAALIFYSDHDMILCRFVSSLLSNVYHPSLHLYLFSHIKEFDLQIKFYLTLVKMSLLIDNVEKNILLIQPVCNPARFACTDIQLKNNNALLYIPGVDECIRLSMGPHL
jgi:hypothetical protein